MYLYRWQKLTVFISEFGNKLRGRRFNHSLDKSLITIVTNI